MNIPAVGVVVPVHDEEDLLARCLASIERAADAARDRAHVEIIVVLDACTDRSSAIADRFAVTALTIDARQVGVARRVGTEHALRGIRSSHRPRTWLSHTDADSTVPTDWIIHQLDLMEAGADVVLGTVTPDFDDLTPAHVAQWKETHRRGHPNGNVHGANLGFRASVYTAVGGFADVPEHEDVQFVEAARRHGAVLVASDVADVTTSGRLVGRTPGGYAGFLRERAARFAS